MSADFYMDCPCCGKKDSVRVDRTSDIDIYEDGSLTTEVTAYCCECRKEFKIRTNHD